MFCRTEVAKSLRTAMKALEKAKRTREEENDGMFSKHIWIVGAELEYLTFIIAQSSQGLEERWKETQRTSRVIDIDAEISAVRMLLKDAESAMDINLEDVYRKVWLARGRIIKIQKRLETTNGYLARSR